MNYRHRFHAGNFADLMKHIALCFILEKLKEKPTPFFVLDTHAGEGIYDLASDPSQRTREYTEGIEPIAHLKIVPEILHSWKQMLESFQPDSQTLSHYPGSPAMIQYHLRSHDRAALCEAHTETFSRLAHYIIQQNVACHERDGIEALGALLPPKEKRGLILIDPSYEKEEEWEEIPLAILRAHQKFPQGIYALWYPIKNHIDRNHLLRHFTESLIPKIWVAEIDLSGVLTQSNLTACGMMIINPPWKLEEQYKEAMAFLCEHWCPGETARAREKRYNGFWLMDEKGEVQTFL